MSGPATESSALDAALARTEREYASLPYSSRAFAHSHPARTGAIARLLGLDPPAIETARVLEMGCASGGNLIPVAAHFPQSHCLGIDISDAQIEQGKARMAALGLDNIELRCASITDPGDDLGMFDYIVAHGVYSWVPPAVREALWQQIGRLLAPNGVAYVSFNVLPGWRLHQPFRDALTAMIPESADTGRRVMAGRQLIDVMREFTLDEGEYGSFVKRFATHLLERPPELLFHDLMEANNEAFLVSDVLEDAARHGLQYLGDAEVATMHPGNYGEAFGREIAERTRGSAIAAQQLYDILSGRAFRRMLLVKEQSATPVSRTILPRQMESLHLMVWQNATLAFDGNTVRTNNGSGMLMTARDGNVVTALRTVLSGAPGSVPLSECMAAIDPSHREETTQMLSLLVANGTLLAALAPMATSAANLLPRATRLARGDAAAGEELTANPRHESVEIEGVPQILLPALDGTRDPGAIADWLVQAMRDGRLDIQGPSDPAELKASILAALPGLLSDLAEKGLLEA